jgi:paspaline synthase
MGNSPIVSAILEYRDELGSVAEFLRVLAGICWTLNYFSMMYVSGRERIPNTGIFPLCCDIAWEFVYAFVHPAASAHWEGGVRVWFLVHCAVITYILKFAPSEWNDAPIVKRNIYFIYGVVILGFVAGQLSLAGEIGPDLGFFWGGVLCQTLASLGPICQLLSRNNTRGSSLLTWYALARLHIEFSLVPQVLNTDSKKGHCVRLQLLEVLSNYRYTTSVAYLQVRGLRAQCVNSTLG